MYLRKLLRIDVTFHDVSNNDKSPTTESRKQTSGKEEEEKEEFYNLASEKKNKGKVGLLFSRKQR